MRFCRELELKVEQRDAVASLLDGHDILTVLSTGFAGRVWFSKVF